MNLLERVFTLLRANLNTVVEKAEDPEKALRQLQLDMRNQLVQVKTQVATAIAESHRLQKRSEERMTEADKWMKKAEQAVRQGNDDAARAALARYNDFRKQSQRYLQQKQEQEQLVATMRSALRQLEAKIAEVETTIDLLVTRRRNALIQQRVFDALSKTGGTKDRERAARAQDAVIDAEARARALAELHERDLDVQLDQLSDERLVERQLNEMKARQRRPYDPPLLQEGESRPSPLLRPRPQSGEPAQKREKKRPRPNEAEPEAAALQDVDVERLKEL
ncbi:MAG TPA: PspA/IM30 family protein [Ktedonobacteraceae bacterium]|jgi:phage shock protein A|nr:PspA/IM30 family protein [Ktedonobacteraceae bacterium]